MKRMAHQQGFTLLEVLLVVVLMAVLTGVAVVSLNPADETRRLHTERERLMSKLLVAASVAQMDEVEIGWLPRNDGYVFVRLDNKTQRWQEIRDIAILKRQNAPDITFAWRDAMLPEAAAPTESSKRAVPELIVYSSGESTPGTLLMSVGGLTLGLQLNDSGLVVEKERSDAMIERMAP